MAAAGAAANGWGGDLTGLPGVGEPVPPRSVDVIETTEQQVAIAAEARAAYADLARAELAKVRAQAREVGFSRDMKARCEALADADMAPPRVSRNGWVWSRVITIGSRIERAFVLQQVRATFGALELGRMLAEAFEPLEGGGYRYDWSDDAGRRALARLVMLRCMARVVRASSVNGSPSKRLVLAVFRAPQALFVTALTRANGRPYSRRTHSRDAKRLAALGCTIVRPPADRVPRNEVGPSGQNVNRYMMERIRRRGERHTRKASPTPIGASLNGRSALHAQWAELAEQAELQRIERRPRGAAISAALRRRKRESELLAAVAGPPAPQ